MSKYYITVTLMGGHNRKIDALNEYLITFRDKLVTSDESKAAVQKDLTATVDDLNVRYSRCHDWSVNTWGATTGTEYISVQGTSGATATLMFHGISGEL